MNDASRFVVWASALVVLLSATGVVSAAGGGAEGLLAACAGREGLYVVIGCGGGAEASLPAALARGGARLVHGIALTDEALAAARKAIAAAGAGGLATVEKLPLRPLPYRDNLADVVVLADPAGAKAAGLTRAEALRVLAPGGALCERAGDGWRATVKPWPAEMDDWTHGDHGPEGNCVSADKTVRWPLGYRWNAGLPMNLRRPKRNANAWSSTRGLAVTRGRCFVLSDSVLEDLAPTFDGEHGLDQYVTARDAFNGLLLWRRRIGATYYGGLFYPNRAPFAAVGDRVYVAHESGRLLALDAATGRTALTFETTHIPGVILVDGGVVVAATWKDGARVGGETGVDRRRMTFALAAGAVEAFDAADGRKLWSLPRLVTSARSADGVVFLVTREGPDELERLRRRPRGKDAKAPRRPKQTVLAVRLRSGERLWEVGPDVLGADAPLALGPAGLGIVAVDHDNGARTTVLSAADGKVILQAKAGAYAALYEGAVHIGPKRYDPKTGKPLGPSAFNLARTICTPRLFVNGMTVTNRGCGFIVDGKPTFYGGARGGCLFASVPACGAFFTPQNWCRCAPSQIAGFVCFGPVADVPTVEQMQAPPLREKGPAFGSLSGSVADGDWPTYRGNPQRSNAAARPAPTKLELLWKRPMAPKRPAGRVAVNWAERLTAPVTAPVVAQGVLVAAATDAHEVVALDAASGRALWRAAVGGRVDTPPTIHDGACLFGCSDGWVYALDCQSGRLAWRMRAAPREERMVSYGQVESPWPAVGTVLVTADGVGYVSAGRSQGSDGGLVVRAFEPATGKILWSRALPPVGRVREMRINDLAVQVGDTVQVMTTRLDAKTGEVRKDKPPAPAPAIGLEGFACGNWTRLGNRKHGAMSIGPAKGEMVSWQDGTVAVNRGGKRVDFARRGGDAKARSWSRTVPAGCQVTSMVVCPNAVVLAGGAYGKDSAGGFVEVLAADSGQVLCRRELPAPPTYNGLAVAGGRVYVTLADGSAVCLGVPER